MTDALKSALGLKTAPSYYCLEASDIPDDEYTPSVPVHDWIARCSTAGPEGFAAGSLSKPSKLSTAVMIERTFGVPFYFFLNVLPLLLPLAYFTGTLWLLLVYAVPLSLGFAACSFLPRNKLGKGMEALQYAYTERNTSKYLSLKMLWPKALHYPAMSKQPLIFCVVPHGYAPLGITAYPLWSKLFGPLTRWTTAPVVLKIPIIGSGLRAIGYLPAKTRDIEDTLTKKEQSVGVVLDGIAGMFQVDDSVEKAYVNSRKGIVKIALRSGAPLVPVYAFGHTSLWRVVTDPFGLLQKLSIKLDVSLVLCLGRWFWPLGPPLRTPVLVALGDPIVCPKTAEPSKEMVEEYHAKLCAGYQKVFDTHKAAYGWEKKSLQLV